MWCRSFGMLHGPGCRVLTVAWFIGKLGQSYQTASLKHRSKLWVVAIWLVGESNPYCRACTVRWTLMEVMTKRSALWQPSTPGTVRCLMATRFYIAQNGRARERERGQGPAIARKGTYLRQRILLQSAQMLSSSIAGYTFSLWLCAIISGVADGK